jgi:hypothetical protein
MVNNHFGEDRGGENTVDTEAITNFRGLCDMISKLDRKIAGALVIREGKLLAASNGAGSTLPSPEYLSKLIRQAQIMVGIPLANKPFFGNFIFTLVSYERLDSMLFYLKTQRAILGIGLLPPYDMTILSNKIQEFLKQNDWLRRTYTTA